MQKKKKNGVEAIFNSVLVVFSRTDKKIHPQIFLLRRQIYINTGRCKGNELKVHIIN